MMYDSFMTKILVAEDDSSMRQFLTLALEKAGYEVTSCGDGLEALNKLENESDHALLLADIVMPGMDGIELSRKASAINPKLKVMYITGFSAVSLGQKAEDAAEISDTKILSKPFHLKDLVAQIDTLLAA